MSDNAAPAPVSTPAEATAPVQTPAPAPAAEPQQPTTPLTRDQARAQLRAPTAQAPAAPAQKDEAMPPAAPEGEAAEAVKEDAQGRLHGPDGKFVEKEKAQEGEAPAAEKTAEEAAPEAADDAAKPEAEAGEKLPEGFVALEIPEGDPLRDQGIDSVPVPEKLRDAFKNLLNRPVKRAELEGARTQAEQLEQRVVQYEAALRSAQEFNTLLITNPKILQTHQQIREDQGDEAAFTWLNGLLAQHSQNVGKYLEEAQTRTAAERQQRAASEFAQTALTTARQALPPEIVAVPGFGQHYQRALAAYATDLQLREAAGEQTAYSADEFIRDFLKPTLTRVPEVKEIITRWKAAEDQKAEERRRQENAAKEREALERTTKLAEENPLGAVPSTANTGHQPAAPSAGPVSYREARRGLKAAGKR